MRIAVMGSGGVGGYFGARLAQAGCEVGFIARGAHLAALRERGLVVESKLGNISLPKVRVTDDPTTLGYGDGSSSHFANRRTENGSSVTPKRRAERRRAAAHPRQ